MMRDSSHRPPLAARWERYWFGAASLESLCLLRILYGGILLLALSGLHDVFTRRHSAPGWPGALFPVIGLLEGFHAPWPGLGWLPMPSRLWYVRLEELLALLAVLLTVGLATRLVAAVTALLFTYLLLLSQFNYQRHFLLLAIVLWVLPLTRCGEHYALDAWRRDPARPPRAGSVLPIRVLQWLLCAIYAMSFLSKLNAAWLSGAIAHILRERGIMSGPVARLAFAVLPDRAITLGIMGAEVLCAVGLANRRMRPLAVAVGVALHAAIALTMNVGTFSEEMVALYVVFLGRAVVAPCASPSSFRAAK